MADVSYGAHTSMLCSIANIGYEVRYELRWTPKLPLQGKLGAIANRQPRRVEIYLIKEVEKCLIGFSDTGPVTHTTSGVISTTATRKVESTVEVDVATAASSVRLTPPAWTADGRGLCRVRFFDRL